MKKLLILSLFCLSVIPVACIVDVTEQNTEKWAYASGKKLSSVSFDASIYHDSFAVQGSSSDTLIADGTFSLWAPGSNTASTLAQDINLFWSVDTLHQLRDTLQGKLFAYSNGPQKELISINKMAVMVPRQVGLFLIANTTDVSVQGMTGNSNVAGSSSNIAVDVPGRITLQTTSGTISGTSGLGGSAQSVSGDISLKLSSPSFETILVRDSTGNVNLHVPTGVGITFFLATRGGNIVLSYDNVSQSSVSAITTNVNGGGKVINVATATGNITVSN